MKTCIVTGATGFIGTSVVRQLSDSGIKTFCVVRSKDAAIKKIGDLKNIIFLEGSLDELEQICSGIDEKIDTFYHFAWQGSTGNERADYALQLQNAKWSADAATVAVKLGCERFVCTGTLAEFDINSYASLIHL